MPRIRVLVADAQRLFAEALAIALRSSPDLEVIEHHPTKGFDAAESIIRESPDVALVDYWMVDMDGPAIIRAVNAWSSGNKVLILSWFHSSAHIRDSLRAGAVGFLPKSLSFAQVLDAVQRVHAGETPVYAKSLAELMDVIDQRGDDAEVLGMRLLTLTPREVEILQLLNLGLSSKDVAARLDIKLGTVKNHIHKILAKTGATSQVEATAWARNARLIKDNLTVPRTGPHWSG